MGDDDRAIAPTGPVLGWGAVAFLPAPFTPFPFTMAKFILFGTYCDNAIEKRTPYRQAHLDGLAQQKADGILITLGPTVDNSKVFGIYEADSEATVRRLIEADPYWQNGIWTDYDVKAWIQAF